MLVNHSVFVIRFGKKLLFPRFRKAKQTGIWTTDVDHDQMFEEQASDVAPPAESNAGEPHASSLSLAPPPAPSRPRRGTANRPNYNQMENGFLVHFGHNTSATFCAEYELDDEDGW